MFKKDTIRDYAIWALLVVIRATLTVIFNTFKVQNINKNGIIHSREKYKPKVAVNGSLYQMIEHKVEEKISSKGDWVVLRNGLEETELKASEILTLAKRLSAALSSRGFQQGDGIHIIMNNNNYYHALALATWRMGGIASYGDPALTADTIRFQLLEAGCRFVVCAPETHEEVRKAVAETDVHVLAIGHIRGVENLATLAATTDTIPEPAVVSDPANQCQSIFWSSGTTGRPKGICHSHQSIWNLLSNSGLPPMHYMMTMHFFHFNGLRTVITCMMTESTATYALGEGFTLEKLLQVIKQHRPSVLLAGSHHYVQLSEMDLSAATNLKPSDLNSIKAIVPLGAAVPKTCKDKLRRIFPLAALQLVGYGQTEFGVMCQSMQEFDGLGKIVSGVTMKVVNPDTGHLCKPYEHGEIRAKGEAMMIGYLKQPKSTYFDENGFGMTGDMGFYDENGLMHYVDRIKELLKYCNNHIAPTELEDILQTHPAVAECLVFGMKDPKVQELVSAVVVLKSDAQNANEEAIRDFVNQRVNADFKKIRGKVIFRNAIPRNSAGKLLRREMRKWAEHSVFVRGNSDF